MRQTQTDVTKRNISRRIIRTYYSCTTGKCRTVTTNTR